MTDARALLELIAEYVDARSAADWHMGETSHRDLDAIAEDFASALGQP